MGSDNQHESRTDMDNDRTPPSWRGVLDHIHVAAGASLPMEPRLQSVVIAGVGIPDDRYAMKTGTYSDRHHIDRQITLIETETLQALDRDRGIVLAPSDHRRNLTTRGVPLSHLVGRYFTIGTCVFYGGRLNVPCKYLEQLVGRPVFRPLINRSGLNARVIVGGTISIGDTIQPCAPDQVDPDVRTQNEELGLEAPPEVF
jgi:MOSC domain-containing protein YiiM